MESENPLALNDGDATAEKQMHGESPCTSQLDTSLQSDVDIEQVEPEEFAFLDTATQQATLQIGKLGQEMRTKWLIYIRCGDGNYGFWSCSFCFISQVTPFAEVWSHCTIDLLPQQSCCDQSDLCSSQITTVVIKTYHKVFSEYQHLIT